MNQFGVTFKSLDVAFLKQYLRIEEDWREDDLELHTFLQISKEKMLDLSNKTPEQLDKIGDLSVIAILRMCANFYQNKGTTIGFEREDSVWKMIMSDMREHNL